MPRPPAPQIGPAHGHRLLLRARTGQPLPRREQRRRPGPRAARRLLLPPQAIRGPSHRARQTARGQKPVRASLRPGPRRHGPAPEHRAQPERPVRQRPSRHRLRAEPGQRRRSRARLVPPGQPARGRPHRARRLRSQATGGPCPLRGPGPSQRRPSSARQGQRPEADELATGTTKDAPAGQRDRRVE